MMKHRCVAVLIGVLILPSLVSCGPRAAPAPGDAGTVLPPQAPTTEPATLAQPPFGDDATESVKWARQDLAQRLGVSVDDVTVAAIIRQEFSNDAFYCQVTKERIAKTDPPAVLAGFSILLRASGGRYEYHASGQTVLFCRPLP